MESSGKLKRKRGGRRHTINKSDRSKERTQNRSWRKKGRGGTNEGGGVGKRRGGGGGGPQQGSLVQTRGG